MKKPLHHDPENPPFDLAGSRGWRAGDPISSDSARLFRNLRTIVKAREAGETQTLGKAVHAFKGVLDEFVKG
ncbi:MAG: hypothetical protein NXH79_04510 [Rhodobacteraceae bacterium]|nr:hypothetical protein [Paracoccaceae bacterium]